ncbi:MAG: hypothetical protein Q8Q18_02820 [bacterium]|nr:hypothetical protein [bacterium]
MKRSVTHFFALFCLFLVALPSGVFAADFYVGTAIPADSVSASDLYIFNDRVSVTTAVGGDLTTSAGEIYINAPIESDLLALAGTVFVLAPVADDLRIVGGQVIVGGEVGGDAVIVGGRIDIQKEAMILGDVYLFGGEIFLDGEVLGNVTMRGGSVHFGGKVHGNVIITASTALDIVDEATIDGDLEYSHRKELDIEDSVVAGVLTYNKEIIQGSSISSGNVLSGILSAVGALTPLKILALLISALMLFWLAPTFASDVAERAYRSPVRSFGIGFVIMVVSIPVMLLLLMSIVGYMLSWLIFIVYILLLLVGVLYRPIVIGGMLNLYRANESLHMSPWFVALGVVIQLGVFRIPYIGLTAGIVLWAITIGAVGELAYYKLRELR